MQINFREYSELTAEEKHDGIEAAVMWLKFSFPLLLPCDISENCRVRIVSEAAKVQRERETALDRAWKKKESNDTWKKLDQMHDESMAIARARCSS